MNHDHRHHLMPLSINRRRYLSKVPSSYYIHSSTYRRSLWAGKSIFCSWRNHPKRDQLYC